MAVVAIAAGGRVIGAKRTKKRPGLFKKANPSKGKANINAVPPNNPATHSGGKVTTGQPEPPPPNKGKDSKPQLQTAGVADAKSAGGSSSPNNPSSTKNNSSGSSSSNSNSPNSNPSKPPSNSKPRWQFNTGQEKNYVVFNDSHQKSKPKPKGKRPNGARPQSHHGLQGDWAKHNLKDYDYDYETAPTVTIETGVGYPHTSITNAQIARQKAREAKGKGAWSSTLQEELEYIVDDLNKAGFTKDTIIKVLEQQYKLLEKLKVPFIRIILD